MRVHVDISQPFCFSTTYLSLWLSKIINFNTTITKNYYANSGDFIINFICGYFHFHIFLRQLLSLWKRMNSVLTGAVFTVNQKATVFPSVHKATTHVILLNKFQKLISNSRAFIRWMRNRFGIRSVDQFQEEDTWGNISRPKGFSIDPSQSMERIHYIRVPNFSVLRSSNNRSVFLFRVHRIILHEYKKFVLRKYNRRVYTDIYCNKFNYNDNRRINIF